MVISLINQKRGWIRILEAVIAILLVSSVLVYVIVKNEANVQNKVLADIVSNLQNNILEGIASDDYLRNVTLSKNGTLLQPFVSASLSDPNYNGGYSFNYSLGICEVDAVVCPPKDPYSESDITTEADVYVSERIISSTLTTYSPKLIRLYVWTS